MLKTKFGTRMLTMLMALIALVSLASCVNVDGNLEETATAAVQEQVEEIKANLSKAWDKTAMAEVTSNLKGFITTTKYENVTVSWTSSRPDVISETGVVTMPSADDKDAVVQNEVKVVPVTVTATIKALVTWGEGESKELTTTLTFQFTVKTEVEGLFVGSIAEIKAAAAQYIYDEQGVQRELVSNSSVVFNAKATAVVTAMLQADGTGQFMIHDGTEGIYVYATLEDLKVGDVVTVTGEVYSYYGNLQFGSNINVKVVTNQEVKAGEYRETTPQELEEEATERLIVDGQDKGFKKAGYFGGELVKVYGKVVKQKASAGSGQYFIEDAFTGEQLWVYYKSYTAEMAAELETFVGKYVNVYGVTYDRDSRITKCEILWDGRIEEASAPELTDEQKVTVILAGITVSNEVAADFALSAEGVWEVVSGTGIVIEGTTAKVTCTEEEQKVVLKVTVTVGTASDSKEFEVTVLSAKLTYVTVAEAIELAGTKKDVYTEEKYAVRGEIVSIANAKYGNLTIKDATGELFVYGTYNTDGTVRFDALEVKPQVGDTVVLYGVLGYYDSAQMKKGWIKEHYSPITNANAVQLAGTKKDVYTEEKYAVKGEIVSIANEKYGNLTIKDAEGTELFIYGTYSADGKTRYDALEVKPQVGDTVVLYGILGYYTSAQMKNGCIVFHAPKVEVELTDAEKVVYDKEALTLPGSVAADFELPQVGEKGSLITWEVLSGTAIVLEGAAAKVTRPAAGEADATVTLKATIKSGDSQDSKELTVTVSALPVAGTVVESYNFATNFATYASAWTGSYGEHTITSAELAADPALNATFVLSRANKQNSGNTIDDKPVICAKNTVQYVTVTVLDGSISKVTFNLQQWGSKTFADIHIEYTTDGSTWTTCSEVITTPADLSSTELPAGVTAVRLSFVASESKNTQIGLAGCELTVNQ